MNGDEKNYSYTRVFLQVWLYFYIGIWFEKICSYTHVFFLLALHFYVEIWFGKRKSVLIRGFFFYPGFLYPGRTVFCRSWLFGCSCGGLHCLLLYFRLALRMRSLERKRMGDFRFRNLGAEKILNFKNENKNFCSVYATNGKKKR